MKKQQIFRRAQRRKASTKSSSKNAFFAPHVQRETTKEKEEPEMVQKKSTAANSTAVPAHAQPFIASLGNSGKNLPATQQKFFGSRMGADFSQVKLHTGEDAEISTTALHARAYTVGKHIVFNKGEYNPESLEGQHLLAHELTHVMQQNGTGANLQRTEDPKEITAPVPKDAVIDKESGDASFTISGLNFVAEPDGVIEGDKVTWREQEVEPEKSGATTAFALDYRISFSKKSDADIYTKASVSYTIYIKTFYKKGVDKTAASGYGRGTTEEDKKAGNTSLKFHESQHGKDIQDYIVANPLPTVKLKFPATQAAFDAAKTKLAEAIAAYSLALQTHSEKHTDEVGTPKTPPPPPAKAE